MHNRSDQLSKNILRDALSHASTSETEVEVLAATQKIDVYTVPDPARKAEREQMGLLGEPVRAGVYEAVAGFQMRIVVLVELPRVRETLLLRMLGAGRLLGEALADLFALPADAWERSVTTPLLIHFGLAGPQKLETNEEDDVSAEIQAWFEEYQQTLRAEGRIEGRAAEAAQAVLTALRVRGIAVPDAVRESILAQKDPERLERWHERAIVAASIADVLDEPS
jgi:hypothetical protein